MGARDVWQTLINGLVAQRLFTAVHRRLAMNSTTSINLGDLGEQRALDYLQQHQLTLLLRNYQCAFGEIDLIMRDGDCLVFVEVKQRKHSRYGSPLEMVSVHKQEKLRRSAEFYLEQHKISQHRQAMRFDVVGIIADAARAESVQWIKNAF